MDKTIKQSVSEMYIAALEAQLLQQATARKEARLVAAQARLAGAEADLEAARKAVAGQQASFEALEKVLEAAREAVFEQASVRRQARKSLNKVARKAALVKGNIKLEAVTAAELQAAWVVLEEVVGEYYSRLDHARRQEEAAYVAYAKLQCARRALRSAGFARDTASNAVYRAESAPVVVRMPVWACRSMARKADEASEAKRAELKLVIDQLSRAQAEAVAAHDAYVRKHGVRVPAPMAEGFLSPGDRRTGVPDVWVMSDGAWGRHLVSHLVRLLDDWKDTPLAVAKVKAAIGRVQDIQEANRLAMGSFVLPGHCKATAAWLNNRAVSLAKQRGLAVQALNAVPAPALPVYPVQQAWVPVETSGSKLVPDSAPAEVKAAVASARAAWEADRSPANLRRLNSALAKAAFGAPLAAPAKAKPIGRAAVDATAIEPVYAALRKDIHALDSKLGRMLVAFGVKDDAKRTVNKAAEALDLLVAQFPSELRDQALWSCQKMAAKQAFIALKTGALDMTRRGWTGRALQENARLFAACCAVRLEGESFAPAQANSARQEDVFEIIAAQEERQAEEAEEIRDLFVFEGEEEAEPEVLDLIKQFNRPFAGLTDQEEEEEEESDQDGTHSEVALLATGDDRQVDSLASYSAHWGDLEEMFHQVKVASTEEAMRTAAAAGEEMFTADLFSSMLK